MPLVDAIEVRDRLTADLHRRREHVRRERQHVRTARRLALIVHQPLRPRQAVVVADWLNGPRAERHRLGGIGHVLVERRVASRRRSRSSSFESRTQIERRRFGLQPVAQPARPRREPPPRVRAGLERRRPARRRPWARRSSDSAPGMARGSPGESTAPCRC